MFNFDPTIKLGDLLTVASFVGIGFGAFYKVKGRLDIHNLKLTTLEETLKTNTATMNLVATQKVEIDHIKQDIFELKHGEGFIFPIRPKG